MLTFPKTNNPGNVSKIGIFFTKLSPKLLLLWEMFLHCIVCVMKGLICLLQDSSTVKLQAIWVYLINKIFIELVSVIMGEQKHFQTHWNVLIGLLLNRSHLDSPRDLKIRIAPQELLAFHRKYYICRLKFKIWNTWKKEIQSRNIEVDCMLTLLL